MDSAFLYWYRNCSKNSFHLPTLYFGSLPNWTTSLNYFQVPLLNNSPPLLTTQKRKTQQRFCEPAAVILKQTSTWKQSRSQKECHFIPYFATRRFCEPPQMKTEAPNNVLKIWHTHAVSPWKKVAFLETPKQGARASLDVAAERKKVYFALWC